MNDKISELNQTRDRLERAMAQVRDALWAERTRDGFWIGVLASSALATATAVSALSVVFQLRPDRSNLQGLIERGIDWLAENQRDDGGWGDTSRSASNIAMTMLARAAFQLSGTDARHSATNARADAY